MSEQNLEARVKQLEQYVEWLLVAQANPFSSPLSDAQSNHVTEIRKRIGWRGYRIVEEKLNMQEAQTKYDSLKKELETLEQDFPKLKGAV